MSLILSIETATPVCSIALHQEGQLLGNQSLFLAHSHSDLLVPSIKSLLIYCDVNQNQLNAIAVSKGPGSYTGLRIGASTAKGLCDALDIPLIAINTLEAMAVGVRKYNINNAYLCPMIDARRMEVYSLITDNEGNRLEETQPVVVDENSYKKWLEKEILFFGDGANKCKDVINNSNAHFIDNIKPDAVHVGALANIKWQDNEFEDLAYFTPFYLKEFRVTKPKAK